DDPVSRLLLDDLGLFTSRLREPRGHPLEEFAGTFSSVQDELGWVLLKLDAMLYPPPPSNPVIDSIRHLSPVTPEDLRVAVLFLKSVADLQDRVGLILPRNPSGAVDAEGEAAVPEARVGEAPEWRSGRFSVPDHSTSDCAREATAIQAALQTL